MAGTIARMDITIGALGLKAVAQQLFLMAVILQQSRLRQHEVEAGLLAEEMRGILEVVAREEDSELLLLAEAVVKASEELDVVAARASLRLRDLRVKMEARLHEHSEPTDA